MMDTFIYYRILNIIVDEEKITRTELVKRSKIYGARSNQLDHLVKLGLIKQEIAVLNKRQSVLYEITDRGRYLRYKMNLFFTNNEQLLKQLHTKLKLDSINEKVVLLPS